MKKLIAVILGAYILYALPVHGYCKRKNNAKMVGTICSNYVLYERWKFKGGEYWFPVLDKKNHTIIKCEDR